MHPASTTAASNGLSGAALVILIWLLSMAHVQVPAEVAAAIGVVIASGIGYVMHGRIAAMDATPADPVKATEIAAPATTGQPNG